MPKFVVHKHKATRLHYDFRLELDRVAKSWAVPKQPPLKPGIRRLAVRVSDHSISYMKFEGEIPEGTYGAGTVKIWDKGTFKLIDKKPGKIVIEMKGEKMKGEYCLIKFPRSGPKNWLLFKVKKK
ncbi:MAG: 3'-phosphoesterase [Nanoarchaeota archaeon]|nr:3'-phosphoesterase [Nanoarchaeota archaeon]